MKKKSNRFATSYTLGKLYLRDFREEFSIETQIAICKLCEKISQEKISSDHYLAQEGYRSAMIEDITERIIDARKILT